VIAYLLANPHLLIAAGLLGIATVVWTAFALLLRDQHRRPASATRTPAGADEQYGADLATMTALLAITAEQPTVDTSDTGRAVLRVRAHVDDTLVALCGHDKAALADARERADATGTLDLAGLWALLDAQDALDEAEVRATAETLALHCLLVGDLVPAGAR
jgi:hypothetical protein